MSKTIDCSKVPASDRKAVQSFHAALSQKDAHRAAILRAAATNSHTQRAMDDIARAMGIK